MSRWLGTWTAATLTPARRHYAVTDALVRAVTANVRAQAPVVPASASERPVVNATGEPAGDMIAGGEVLTFDARGVASRKPLTPAVFGHGPLVHFDPRARCPLIGVFLEDSVPDARQRDALLRWIAAAIVPSRAPADVPRHLLLAGPDDAGGWSGRALSNLIMALASPSASTLLRVPRRTPLRLTVERAIDAASGGRACRFSLRGASPKLRAELDALIDSAKDAAMPRLIIETNWSHPAAAAPHLWVPRNTLRIDLRSTPIEYEVALRGSEELPGLMARALRAAGLLGGSARRSSMLPCQSAVQPLN